MSTVSYVTAKDVKQGFYHSEGNLCVLDGKNLLDFLKSTIKKLVLFY